MSEDPSTTTPGGTEPAGDAARGDAARVGLNLLGMVVQVSGPAYHALLSRALGTGGYGLYTWSSSFVDGLSLFVAFAMDLAVRRYVGEALARGRRGDVHAAVGAALRVVWTFGLALAAGMYAAAPYVARWQGKAGLVTPLRVLAVGPVLVHTATIFIYATQAAGVMRYGFVTRSVVQPISLFALIGLASYLHPATATACGAIVATGGLTALVSGFFYHRMYGLGPTLRAALTPAIPTGPLRFAFPLVFAGMFWTVLGRLDLMVYGLHASAADVGVYGGCLLFATSVPQMKGAFEVVVAAFIPHALATGDLVGLRASLRRQTRWAAVVIAPVAILFGGFSDVVLEVLGGDFVRGARALSIMVAGHSVSALCLSAWVVPLSGHARWSAATAAAFVVVDALLLHLLVPRYGMVGAAIAASFAVAGSQLALAAQAHVIAGVQPFTRGVGAAVLAGAIALAAGRGLFHLLAAPLLVRAGAAFAVAGVVYLAGLVALGLDVEERALVRRVTDGARALLPRA